MIFNEAQPFGLLLAKGRFALGVMAEDPLFKFVVNLIGKGFEFVLQADGEFYQGDDIGELAFLVLPLSALWLYAAVGAPEFFCG